MGTDPLTPKTHISQHNEPTHPLLCLRLCPFCVILWLLVLSGSFWVRLWLLPPSFLFLPLCLCAKDTISPQLPSLLSYRTFRAPVVSGTNPIYVPITTIKHTTLPSKFVMFSVSKSGPDPVETLGLPDVSRAHCLPPKRRFLEVLKIICALIYQALTSFDPLLPDKKLLPFCRGPPSVGDVSVRCTHLPHQVQESHHVPP